MEKFRKFLCLLFILAGFAFLGLAAAAYGARFVGEPGRVSQVFKRIQSIPLGPGNRLGWYEAAVTPSAPDRTAVLCHILVLSGDSPPDLIEKKVWLLPHDPIPYAYYETLQARNLTLVLLGFGLLLIILAIPLYPPK